MSSQTQAPPTASDQLELGVFRHLRGDLEGAVRSYRAVLEADPCNTSALNNLGFAQAQAGRWEEAVELYLRALEVDPGDATAHLNLGNARAAQGNLDAAVTELMRAAELDPASFTARDNLAQMLLLRGDAAGAEASWRSALAVTGPQPRVLTALATAVAAQQRLDEAASLLEHALQLDAGFAPAWAQLGAVLLLRGDLASAVYVLRRSSELLPDDTSVRRHFAIALLAAGEPAVAAAELAQVVMLDPSDVGARVDLAVLRLAAGFPREALAHLDQALELEPADQRAALHRALAMRQLEPPDDGDVTGRPWWAELSRVAEGPDPVQAQRASALLRDLTAAGSGV